MVDINEIFMLCRYILYSYLINFYLSVDKFCGC